MTMFSFCLISSTVSKCLDHVGHASYIIVYLQLALRICGSGNA